MTKPDRHSVLLKLHQLHEGLYSRVANRLGVDPSYVSRVARGERKSSTVEAALLDDLVRIAKQTNRVRKL